MTNIYFLTVLEAESLRLGCQHARVPGEASLPGLQMAAFSLHPHIGERDHPSPVSSLKGTNPIMGPHPNGLSQPDYLPKGQLQIPSQWRLGLQHKNSGGAQQAVHSAFLLSGHPPTQFPLCIHSCQRPVHNGTERPWLFREWAAQRICRLCLLCISLIPPSNHLSQQTWVLIMREAESFNEQSSHVPPNPLPLRISGHKTLPVQQHWSDGQVN